MSVSIMIWKLLFQMDLLMMSYARKRQVLRKQSTQGEIAIGQTNLKTYFKNDRTLASHF